jgi:hypothetical protein
MNRDHVALFWGQLAGIAGLIVSGTVDLSALGLSEKHQHVAMVVCGVIAAVSGRLATSPLPGAPKQ